MSDPGSVTSLLRQAQAGDVEARARLRGRLAEFVRCLARPRVEGAVRERIGDEDDVEASVGADFFADDDKLTRINAEDRRHLEAVLAQAVNQKIIDYRRKANVRVTAIRESEMIADDSAASGPLAHVAEDNRLDGLSVEIAEALQSRLAPDLLELALLLAEGCSIREIAAMRDVSRYAVEQQLAQIAAAMKDD